MAMVPCPDCGNEIPEHGGGWCPYCQETTRKAFSGFSGGWHPLAAGGRSWGSSTFLTAGMIAAVVSGLAYGYYGAHSDESGWLSLATGAGVLALIWLTIGAVARGVAVGMRERDEG